METETPDRVGPQGLFSVLKGFTRMWHPWPLVRQSLPRLRRVASFRVACCVLRRLGTNGWSFLSCRRPYPLQAMDQQLFLNMVAFCQELLPRRVTGQHGKSVSNATLRAGERPATALAIASVLEVPTFHVSPLQLRLRDAAIIAGNPRLLTFQSPFHKSRSPDAGRLFGQTPKPSLAAPPSWPPAGVGLTSSWSGSPSCAQSSWNVPWNDPWSVVSTASLPWSFESRQGPGISTRSHQLPMAPTPLATRVSRYRSWGRAPLRRRYGLATVSR